MHTRRDGTLTTEEVIWMKQERAFDTFLDCWEDAHGERPAFDCLRDANVGDLSTDFLEYQVYGEETGEGYEAAVFYADGRVVEITSRLAAAA